MKLRSVFLALSFWAFCALSGANPNSSSAFNDSEGIGIGINVGNPLIALLSSNYELSVSPQIIYKYNRHQFYAGFIKEWFYYYQNRFYPHFTISELHRKDYTGFIMGYNIYPYKNVRRTKLYYNANFMYSKGRDEDFPQSRITQKFIHVGMGVSISVMQDFSLCGEAGIGMGRDNETYSPYREITVFNLPVSVSARYFF